MWCPSWQAWWFPSPRSGDGYYLLPRMNNCMRATARWRPGSSCWDALAELVSFDHALRACWRLQRSCFAGQHSVFPRSFRRHSTKARHQRCCSNPNLAGEPTASQHWPSNWLAQLVMGHWVGRRTVHCGELDEHAGGVHYRDGYRPEGVRHAAALRRAGTLHGWPPCQPQQRRPAKLHQLGLTTSLGAFGHRSPEGLWGRLDTLRGLAKPTCQLCPGIPGHHGSHRLKSRC